MLNSITDVNWLTVAVATPATGQSTPGTCAIGGSNTQGCTAWRVPIDGFACVCVL